MTPRHHFDRRTFLKTAGLLAAGPGLANLRGRAGAATAADLAPRAAKLGWRIGIHAYSFRKLTLHESIDRAAEIGVRFLGAYPTQKLSPARPDVLVLANLPAADRRELRRHADDAGLQLVHFGVVGFSEDASRFRETFDFAAELGAEAILAEPPPDAFDALEKLCAEYKIDLAVHNHGKTHPNSRYWDPAVLMKILQGRSLRVGVCGDIGHWARSDLNPLACLRLTAGRLLASHFKDMNQLGVKGHCVPFGTGACDVKGMLAELHRQKANPRFMIEHEFNWDHNVSDIKQSIAYFYAALQELA